MRGERRVREGYGRRIEVTPSAWQDEASITADLDRSDVLAMQLREQGVESWRSYYRWVGPLKVKAVKEVGPPPWPLPHLTARRWRGGKPGLRLGVGWRSTVFWLYVLWAPKPKRGPA